MSVRDFSDADILLADNDLNTRQSVKNILNNHGFRELRLGTDIAFVKRVLDKFMPDLLICSTGLPDGDFVEYVRLIRQGKAGHNPFVPVITLVDQPTPELVGRILESGTDAVIAKPISTAQLLGRIEDLISDRKKFVVADDYVGPARRKDQAVRGVDAPNTLRAKATGEKVSFTEIQAAIKVAKGEMTTLRFDVVGNQIAAHVTNLVPMLEGAGKVTPPIREELIGLLDVTDGAQEKLTGTQYEHAVEMCEAIAGVASAILATRGTPDTKEVKLLKPLSQGVQACFSGAITTPEQVHAIVVQIRSRATAQQ